MKKIANNLVSIAQKNGKDTQIVFAEFLDYIIDCFSIERLIRDDGDYNMIFKKIKDEGSIFFSPFSELMMKFGKIIEENNVYDFFGQIYELMFQNGSKASGLGQFFTPQTIANICSEIIYKDVDGVFVSNEPTCGSGRNLLALYGMDKNKNQYHIAEDVDGLSVKMCAINMMLNGMRGCCICHNTLLPSEFIFGYEVNEVRYPFPCECYSIRHMSKKDYEKRLQYEGFERRSV